MTARESGRFAAHHALEQLGPGGQAAIAASRVVLVGLGGLGCAAAQYLAASGVGHLELCDYDTVEETNLARQVLYTSADIGRPKIHAAEKALSRLNPGISLSCHEDRMDEAGITELLGTCDLLIDASDNYGTRLAANRACLALHRPWVMGSCVRMEGQVTLFTGRSGDACYRCIYGSAPETLEDCPGAGIFAPVAGVVGAAMAHLALGHLSGSVSAPGFHVLDAGRWTWRTLDIQKRKGCPDCAARR